MSIILNFDELNKLHAKAKASPAGSKAWIEFAQTMLDSFPELYKTAKNINQLLSSDEADAWASYDEKDGEFDFISRHRSMVNDHINDAITDIEVPPRTYRLVPLKVVK